MNISYWKNWAEAAAVRAVRTFAQVAIAAMPLTSIVDVDWTTVMGTAALAALLSILTSISGLPEVEAEKDRSTLLASATAAADDLLSFTGEFMKVEATEAAEAATAADIASQETAAITLEPADELGY